MARTVKSSWAGKLMFLAAVDDDNTVEIFKSVSSSFGSSGTGASAALATYDNTAAVRSNMTVDAGVSIASTTWNGHSVSTFKLWYNSGTYNLLRFDTAAGNAASSNRPYFANSLGTQSRLLTVIVAKNLPSHNAWGLMKTNISHLVNGAYGRALKLTKNAASPTVLGFTTESDAGGSTTTQFATGANVTFAFSSKYGAADSNYLYCATAGSTMTTSDASGVGSGGSAYGEILQLGGYTDGSTYLDMEVVAIALILDEYGTTGARDAEVAAIHDDPYGAFFDAAAPTAKPAVFHMNRHRQ